jgi:hypothetical protein
MNIQEKANQIKIDAEGAKASIEMMGEAAKPISYYIHHFANIAVLDGSIENDDFDLVFRKAIEA